MSKGPLSCLLYAPGLGTFSDKRKTQVEHESDYRPPVKGLVELREYGSYPSFLEISCCTCYHKLGVRLLCEGQGASHVAPGMELLQSSCLRFLDEVST